MCKLVGLDQCLGRSLFLELALPLLRPAEMSYLDVAPIFVGYASSASDTAWGAWNMRQRSPVALFVDRPFLLVHGHVVHHDSENVDSFDDRLGRCQVAA